MPGNITVSRHALFGSDSLQPADLDGFAEIVDGHRDRLEDALDKLEKAIAAVQQDQELTPAGKGARIQALGTRTREEIEAIGIPLKIANDLGRAEAALPAVLPIAPEPFADDPSRRNPISLPRRIELVLARLVGMSDAGDPLALQAALRSAARVGDALPLIACQRAPRFVLEVDPKVLGEAVEEYHRTTNGDAWRSREQLRRVRRLLESNLSSAQNRVGSLVGPDLRAGLIAV